MHRFATNFKRKKWKECDRRCEKKRMKRMERSMSRENCTHHERMWMTMKMTDTARTGAKRCSVQCDDALTDKRLCTHIFVLMCSVWKSVLVVMLSLVSVV